VTTSNVERMKLLERAATAGPWGWVYPKSAIPQSGVVSEWESPRGLWGPGANDVMTADDEGEMYSPDPRIQISPSDKAFIIAMRSTFPALLEIAEAAQACLDEREHHQNRNSDPKTREQLRLDLVAALAKFNSLKIIGAAQLIVDT